MMEPLKGIATKLENDVQYRIYRIWYGLHQLNLVIKYAYKELIDSEFNNIPQSWHSVGSYRFSPLDRYRYRSGSVLDRTRVFNIGSVLQGSTNRCNRYRTTIRTDRENCRIYRTEPILIAAGSPIARSSKCGCKAQIRTTRKNAHHAPECTTR